jgi:HEAT repeat protein
MNIFHNLSKSNNVKTRLANLVAAARESEKHKFQTDEHERLKQMAFQVGELGEEAVAPLYEALNDPSDVVRQYITCALTRVPNAEARVKALVTAASRTPLGDIDGTTKGVVSFGEKTLEPLLQALESDNSNVRSRVSDAIAKLGSGIIEQLVRVINHPDYRVREGIVNALCQLRNPQAMPFIINSLNDENELVRREAAYGIRYLKDPAVIPSLANALEDNINGFDTRHFIADSLLELGWSPEAESQKILLAVLNLNPVGGRLLKDKSTQDAIERVTHFGTAATESLLLALESRQRFVQRDAALVLGIICDERARSALMEATKSNNDHEVRENANLALKKLDKASKQQMHQELHVVLEQKEGGKLELANIRNEKICCANCRKEFSWDDAYYQRHTPGSEKYNPPNEGDSRGRVFCPNCGYLIAEWGIGHHEENRYQWQWYKDNAELNMGKNLPKSPTSFWGHPLMRASEVPFDILYLNINDVEQKSNQSSPLESQSSKQVEKQAKINPSDVNFMFKKVVEPWWELNRTMEKPDFDSLRHGIAPYNNLCHHAAWNDIGRYFIRNNRKTVGLQCLIEALGCDVSTDSSAWSGLSNLPELAGLQGQLSRLPRRSKPGEDLRAIAELIEQLVKIIGKPGYPSSLSG